MDLDGGVDQQSTVTQGLGFRCDSARRLRANLRNFHHRLSSRTIVLAGMIVAVLMSLWWGMQGVRRRGYSSLKLGAIHILVCVCFLIVRNCSSLLPGFDIVSRYTGYLSCCVSLQYSCLNVLSRQLSTLLHVWPSASATPRFHGAASQHIPRAQITTQRNSHIDVPFCPLHPTSRPLNVQCSSSRLS